MAAALGGTFAAWAFCSASLPLQNLPVLMPTSWACGIEGLPVSETSLKVGTVFVVSFNMKHQWVNHCS